MGHNAVFWYLGDIHFPPLQLTISFDSGTVILAISYPVDTEPPAGHI